MYFLINLFLLVLDKHICSVMEEKIVFTRHTIHPFGLIELLCHSSSNIESPKITLEDLKRSFGHWTKL